MKPIKTQQRYRCDFCSRTGIKRTMLVHEKRCYRNPNRFCDYCDNKGYIMEFYEGIGTRRMDCPYCSQFDPKMLKEIEEREKEDTNSQKEER